VAVPLDASKRRGLKSVVERWGRIGRMVRRGGCWIWSGPVNGFGYAQCGVQGMQTAQRVTWAWRHGRLPDGVLRNECGNRLCVCPEHWREDVRPVSRLSERRKVMRELHGSGVGIGEIAERVGCSRQTVLRFVRGLPVAEWMGASDDA
jgi:hypothetical protein